jgi:apolipoprotein N-acyltransferase
LLKHSFALELAVLSGLLLTVSFPAADWGVCGWFCLAPLIIGAVASTRRWSFLLGFVTGVVFFSGSLYWIYGALVEFGRFPAWAGGATLGSLVLFLSLYTAVFAFCISALASSSPGLALLAAAPLWVSLEYARNYLITGFPWNLLGYSAWRDLPFLQLAGLGGVYLLSFCLAASNALVAYSLLQMRTSRRNAAVGFAGLLLLAAALHAAGYGLLSGESGVPKGESVPVSIIQGNFPEDQKQDPAATGSILAEHVRMTSEIAGAGSRLIVWSESAVPYVFDQNPGYRRVLENLAVQCRASILFGAVHMERGEGADGWQYYNSAFLVRPDGKMGERYDKIHLVPFSEYNPYKKLLPFFPRVVHAASDFTPGRRIVLFQVDRHRAGAFVCYEAVFPELVRRFSLQGAEWFVNITNDAWFGRTSAPYQHFAMAVVRCVENRRFMLRCANTGVSGIIDPCGRIRAMAGLFTRATLSGTVYARSDLTLYARYGDFVAWLSILVFLIAAGYTITTRYRNRTAVSQGAHHGSGCCKKIPGHQETD